MRVLYHFSENPGIEVFHPRQKSNRTDMPTVVWAIDAEHEVSYLCPRDCPRIVCYREPDMAAADKALFFGATEADVVMTLESRWLPRLLSVKLFRYSLPYEGFELFDAAAGYYVAAQPVVPIEVAAMDNLPGRIAAKGAELRLAPSLQPLRDALLRSSYRRFGIHRFEFAR
ncbi:DUF6886 family protein [Paenibacillus chartarius]|uniref:DUF6886 family protein n=1 Tax=Paenibacillus chartarius TaxID=747481 RepID=A0ABV6DSH8_9BACL